MREHGSTQSFLQRRCSGGVVCLLSPPPRKHATGEGVSRRLSFRVRSPARSAHKLSLVGYLPMAASSHIRYRFRPRSASNLPSSGLLNPNTASTPPWCPFGLASDRPHLIAQQSGIVFHRCCDRARLKNRPATAVPPATWLEHVELDIPSPPPESYPDLGVHGDQIPGGFSQPVSHGRCSHHCSACRTIGHAAALPVNQSEAG
ncbi:hypothetical protein HPP92_022247 [Vanilla planifolia]|uniref:Uncharacterized protein n=1 Tax=Vanilla planifolia TaxID=51239 RepID=A0A835PWZ1_VANPL|nr:hypothetical protein HPP92_022247 [Vanilla planifolia]